MKKTTQFFVYLSFFALTFSSCQKEPNLSNDTNTDKRLEGDWKFVSVSLKAQTIDEQSGFGESYKMVSENDYTSINNKGTIKIDASKLAATNMSYDISTNIKGTYYENGTLEDTYTTPFSFSMPSYSSVASYKLIGQDSIYFPLGGFITADNAASGSGGVQGKPSGCRFTIVGDKLTMTGNVSESSASISQGVTTRHTVKGVSTIVLTKL